MRRNITTPASSDSMTHNAHNENSTKLVLSPAKEMEIMRLLHEMQERTGVPVSTIQKMLRAKKMVPMGEMVVPISIIDHPTLGPLEAIVKYLREERGMRLAHIAVLTGRDQRAIGVAYRMARAKEPARLAARQEMPVFPVYLLQDKKLSVLEHIVQHLLDKYCLRLCDIAKITGKDHRTIWTIRERAKKKQK